VNVVWVVQEGNNDYSPAEHFGEVHFITAGELMPMKNSRQNGVVSNDIRAFKSLYVQDSDYIIPTGNPMTVALAIMSLGAGDHKFLKWDGRRHAYVPHTLNSGEL